MIWELTRLHQITAWPNCSEWRMPFGYLKKKYENDLTGAGLNQQWAWKEIKFFNYLRREKFEKSTFLLGNQTRVGESEIIKLQFPGSFKISQKKIKYPHSKFKALSSRFC
mgnify:CR=1 FL=1